MAWVTYKTKSAWWFHRNKLRKSCGSPLFSRLWINVISNHWIWNCNSHHSIFLQFNNPLHAEVRWMLFNRSFFIIEWSLHHWLSENKKKSLALTWIILFYFILIYFYFFPINSCGLNIMCFTNFHPVWNNNMFFGIFLLCFMSLWCKFNCRPICLTSKPLTC